jgi:hypothetical protein
VKKVYLVYPTAKQVSYRKIIKQALPPFSHQVQIYIARRLDVVLHGLKERKAVLSLITEIHGANITSRKSDQIGVIIVAPPISVVPFRECSYISVRQQLVYHDDYLVVLNNVPTKLMNLIAWDAAICHLDKHGRWDKKRNH